jgi:hypothetical protein
MPAAYPGTATPSPPPPPPPPQNPPLFARCQVMAQVSLLDSAKLSELLEQALSWRASVSSLMVSATNGAVLAYAFRDGRPTMKDIRSLSTTTTTAYTVASEDVLVFEAQLSRALSVLAPVADQVLLAVHGPGRHDPMHPSANNVAVNGDMTSAQSEDAIDGHRERSSTDDEDDEREQDHIRTDLEYVSESLAAVLREELQGMRWPEDI